MSVVTTFSNSPTLPFYGYVSVFRYRLYDHQLYERSFPSHTNTVILWNLRINTEIRIRRITVDSRWGLYGSLFVQLLHLDSKNINTVVLLEWN